MGFRLMYVLCVLYNNPTAGLFKLFRVLQTPKVTFIKL